MMFQKNLQNFLLAAKMQKKTWNPMLDSRPYFTGGFDLAKGSRAMETTDLLSARQCWGMVLDMG